MALLLWIFQDDPAHVTRFAMGLRGHDLLVADRGRAAIRLRQEPFDVVIFEGDDREESVGAATVRIAIQSAVVRSEQRGRPMRLVRAPWSQESNAFGPIKHPAMLDETLRRELQQAIEQTNASGAGAPGAYEAVESAGLLAPDGQPASDDQPLRVVFGQVSKQALRWLADHPDALSDLHWRDFETLVADLFDRAGFDVTLTAASEDRGADLYVARHTGLGSLLYVVECKRYRRDRPVGPGLVRELRGVVDRERANAGILVTTSFFSEGARDEQRTIPFRISLRDNQAVRHWLRGATVF
jgi:hypothetical protein